MSREAPEGASIAQSIFRHYHLGEVVSIERCEIGFSNDLYFINEAYVLKLGNSEEAQADLTRELYFCRLFQGRLPVPKIIVADTSLSVFDRLFVMYEKIVGDNLYARWHLYSDTQRKEIVRQICALLRAINATPVDEAMKQFDSAPEQSWQERIGNSITEAVDMLERRNALPPELLQAAREFLDRHSHVLQEQRIALTYFDPHFDNLLMRDAHIVGLLDFERTGLMSIDYVLDLVRRMVEYPSKYVSAKYRPFIRDADYAHLMTWYREFYPELFAFHALETRLNLYSVEHTLRTMLYYPEDEALQRILVQYLSSEE